MCLAKAYVLADDAQTGLAQSGDAGATLVMENVTQMDVDGDTIRIRSLFGDVESLQGRVTRVDFAEGRLLLHRDPKR